MKQLVRLKQRPSRDGMSFKYMLDYVDENGARKRLSLAHADKRKAERQRAQKERELRMGIVAPQSMRLSEFLKGSIERTRGQVREGTLVQQKNAMESFISLMGNMDLLKVEHKHGELFIQRCLESGNRPATVNKKVRGIKRLFNLAVKRQQLEENPFRHVDLPKTPQQKINIYSPEQCTRIVKSASDIAAQKEFDWGLLVVVALCTGMRRGELLNTVWRDIDFEKQTIDVAPKDQSDQTWEWYIKDAERRTLPLTEEIVTVLAEHQAKQPEGNPYVFVPHRRFKHIQAKRKLGQWTIQHGTCPINNFKRGFDKVLNGAGLSEGEFHDLRRTCLTRWFANGLSEYEVMRLAGHSSFSTTHEFYLAVSHDLVDRARLATPRSHGQDLARIWRAPLISQKRS